MMKGIESKDTEILLLMLDSEIKSKCNEIKKKKNEEKLKKTFFISCCLFVLIFIIQMFLRLLNVSYITSFILYQSIIVIVIAPMLFSSIKGGVLK